MGGKCKALLQPHTYMPLILSCKCALHCAIGFFSNKTVYEMRADASILRAIVCSLVAVEKSLVAAKSFLRAGAKTLGAVGYILFAGRKTLAADGHILRS